MIRNIITLTLNDLAIAFKNKTFYLILFIPFFVYFSLNLIDKADSDFRKMNIGFIQGETDDSVILKTIQSANQIFTVSSVVNEAEGQRLLKEKKLDCLLLQPEKEQNSSVLVVLKKESRVTLAIVESFSALQKSVEGKSVNWISDIKPLQEGGIQKQTLPTWILMLVLLVSFIIIPAQVAEEKEKKMLLALLQTPMREMQWLIAKLLSGMILIFISVLSLHLLGNYDPGDWVSYIAFIVVGSFCFSAYGIFLGFLCRNQASARTVGVIFYLPHLLPSALSDYSSKLSTVAPLLPSYQFYEPVETILLEGGRVSNLFSEWIYLLIFGTIASLITYLLMKKRWLM